jgi:hypothetical protein
MLRAVTGSISSVGCKTYGYATKATPPKPPKSDLGPKIACVALTAIGTGAFYVATSREVPREYQGPNNTVIDDD